MTNPDPLSFLDKKQVTKSDPLSFLDNKKEPTKDPLSFLDKEEKQKEPEKPSFWEKTKNYFTSGKFGEANLMQMQSGGFSGAPNLTPEQAKKVATEAGTILAVETAFAPILGAATAAKFAPRVWESLGHLTRAGTTGAAVTTTSKLVEEGEFPTQEELVEHGATWVAIDAAMQALHLGAAGGKIVYDFGEAVNNIAKAENVPRYQVLNRLWDSAKNFIRSKFGRTINTPEDIILEDVQVLIEQAQEAEKAVAPKDIEIKVEKVPEKAEVVPVKEVKKVPEKVEIAPKKPYELSFDEAEKELQKLHDFERKILEPKVGKEAYAVFEKSGFEGQREFWDKYKDRFTEEELNVFENYPYTSEDLRSRLNDIRSLRTSYNSGETPEESINNVISDIRKDLILVENPANKALAKDAFKYLIDKGHTKEEIAKQVFKVLKRDLSESDAQYILDSLFKPSEQKSFQKLADNIPKQETSQITNNEVDIARANVENQKKRIKEIEQSLKKEGLSKAKKKELDKSYSIEYEGLIIEKRRLEKLEALEKLRNVEKELDKSLEEPEEIILSKKPTQTQPKEMRRREPVMGKKQAVARSKILKLFRTAFKDPIRLGKFKQHASGIHKLWPKVTRLLKDNNVETAAHEIGHNLHTTLYGGDAKTPQEQVNNINKALRPYLNELKPMAHYEPWGMEGFAEFTRLYVTNPDVAKKLAPNFYNKFEADLEAQYPEMKNALLEARGYYEDYLQGTPESRIRAQTSYGDDKGKLENIIDAIKKKLAPDYLKTQFLDDVFPAKRVVAEAFEIPLSEVENLKDERNLYRAVRVLKGAVGKADVFILHETFDPLTLDTINGSLRDILKQLPDDAAYKEFNDYLIARRSIEKAGQNIDTGINLGDAIAVEQNLRPKYEKLAKELDKYNDTLLKYAQESGLLSGEQYAAIKKNNLMYVPFQRVMEPEKGGVAKGGGKLQAGKPIKRMKGSTRDIIAPIESVIKNTYSIIINAEKNLVGQTLGKIAKMKDMGAYVERLPTPIKLKSKIQGAEVARQLAKRFEQDGLDELIEYDEEGKAILREDIADAIPEVFLKFGATHYPPGENIITVYEKGKPVYYEVSPELFEMWTQGIEPYTANLITKILRIPARTLRAGAILNPKFIQKNFIRDTWGSWLFTKYGKSIKDPVGLFIDTLYSPLAMFATAAGKGKLYVEWMKSGGGMSTMQSLDRDSLIKKLEEIRHGYKPYQVIKWLRQAAEISEEMNRLAEFGRALEIEGKTRLGREIAAFSARDLSIDFAKMGLQVKALNQIIPFFNATVQGGDKLVRTMANPKDRKDFIPRIIGFIVIPSLILAWLNKDDERIKEFYEEEKDFNFLTSINGTIIKIPVPFETGVIVHGLTQRLYNYFVNKDDEAFEKFMGSIWSAISPSFIPSFANPFIETWANKNFFTNARIIPRAQEDLISRYQYKNTTSSTARLIGRAMAYMIGEDTRSKAASPPIIDHFINSWTGGLGRLMVTISDESLEAAGLSDKIPGPEQTIIDKLGLNAFESRYPRASTRSIEKFYDNYADATARQKSKKYAEKMEIGTEEEREAGYKRFEKIYDYKTLQMAYKSMQACQKEINNIWNDPSIDQEQKKVFIDALYLQMIEFAKAANEDIKQYRLAQ